MVRHEKFHRQSNYRCRDNLDEKSESTSGAEAVLKKVKQVSDLMSTRAMQHGDKNTSHFVQRSTDTGLKIKILKYKKEEDLGFERAYEDHSRSSAKSSSKHNLKKKRRTHEPSTLSSNLAYMQDILEELRVARENMLLHMRVEMQKLLGDTISEQTAPDGCSKQAGIKLKKSILNGQNCKGGSPTVLTNGVPLVSMEPTRGSFRKTAREVPTSSTFPSCPEILLKKDPESR